MAQNIANETGFPEPAAIIGSTDITNRRILAAINAAGRWLRKRNAWVILQTEHTFVTVASQAQYSLPADYDRFIPDTTYDRTGTQAYSGPLSPADWQSIKSGGLPNTGITPSFRIQAASNAKVFTIDPIPAVNGDTQVFEYVSKNWVILDSGSTPTDRFGKSADTTADADTTLFDEDFLEVEAKWRFLALNGLPFASARKDAEDIVLNAIASDGGSKTLHMDKSFLDPILAAVTPDVGFGS